MSIELYSGFVGSGKSYCATALGVQVADAPAGRTWVIANFPIKLKVKFLAKIPYVKKFIKNKEKKSRWIYKDNDDLTVEYLIDMSIKNKWTEKESSCLLIFDEASIPFNARSYNKSDRMDWIRFLTQSRKFGYDVIFITQDSRMLDKQIRSLCEYECVHKKMNNFPVLGWFLSIFRISVFAQVRYWNGTNARYTKGQLRLFKFKKRVAERYDTLRLFDLNLNSQQESASKKA